MNINKIISITCIVITVACLTTIGITLPVAIKNKAKNNSVSQSDKNTSGSQGSKNCSDLPEITTHTKEQAVSYLKEAISDKIITNTWCDFIPTDIIGSGDFFNISINYSHTGDLTKEQIEDREIGTLAFDDEFNISINNTNPAYAIIDGKMDSITTGSIVNMRTISFNQTYIDYHEIVDGNSHNASDIVFKNKDKEFIELGSRIIALTGSTNTNPTNLYKYSLEDNGDNYEFIYSHFGIGLDQANSTYSEESGWNISYAINLIQSKFVINKTTGILSRVRNPQDNGYLQILKSYPLTQAEAAQLTPA